MAYLTLIKLEGKYYIQLDKNEEGHWCLAAGDKEGIINNFNGFKSKAMSDSYESHISGSLGIINLSPHVIEVKDAIDLEKYLIDWHPVSLKGKGFGFFLDFHGVEVKEEILELSVYDVAKNIIKEVYQKPS